MSLSLPSLLVVPVMPPSVCTATLQVATTLPCHYHHHQPCHHHHYPCHHHPCHYQHHLQPRHHNPHCYHLCNRHQLCRNHHPHQQQQDHHRRHHPNHPDAILLTAPPRVCPAGAPTTAPVELWPPPAPPAFSCFLCCTSSIASGSFLPGQWPP